MRKVVRHGAGGALDMIRSWWERGGSCSVNIGGCRYKYCRCKYFKYKVSGINISVCRYSVASLAYDSCS